MGSYKLSPEAERDLNVIWLFGLEQFGEAQADKYYYDLLSHFEMVADRSQQYPAVDYIREGYRRSVHHSHSVYYREKPGFIEIMRIYGQQDPVNL